MRNLKWYIPSFYGDIQLERLGPKSCKLTTTDLSRTEKDALRSLHRKARRWRWITQPTDLSQPQTIILATSIEKASLVLARALKSNRTIVSAVRFADDTMLEVNEPDAEARRQILEMALRQRQVAEPLDVEELVACTEGFSCADIENLVKRAASVGFLRAIKGVGPRGLTRTDFDKVLDPERQAPAG